MAMYLVLINKKQRGGLGLAWLGGTHGGPIYMAERDLAGLMAVPSTWQREEGGHLRAGLLAVPERVFLLFVCYFRFRRPTSPAVLEFP